MSEIAIHQLAQYVEEFNASGHNLFVVCFDNSGASPEAKIVDIQNFLKHLATPSASDVTYNDSITGFSASNVQDALQACAQPPSTKVSYQAPSGSAMSEVMSANTVYAALNALHDALYIDFRSTSGSIRATTVAAALEELASSGGGGGSYAGYGFIEIQTDLQNPNVHNVKFKSENISSPDDYAVLVDENYMTIDLRHDDDEANVFNGDLALFCRPGSTCLVHGQVNNLIVDCLHYLDGGDAYPIPITVIMPDTQNMPTLGFGQSGWNPFATTLPPMPANNGMVIKIYKYHYEVMAIV